MLARWRAQSPRQRLLLTTVVLLLLALGLRLARLGAESAWIDEAYSIVLARHSLVDLIRGTVADQHPPLYYLLLKGWLEIANITGLSSLFPMGESGAAQPVGAIVVYARLLSVLIGVVHVGQVLALGRKLGGEWLGLGAGLLVALSPLHVYYSQEVRQYILLAALTTAATAELWKCLQGGGRWWLYALFAALALYTQYFAVFIFIAHALILFWYGLRRAAFGSKFGGEITTRKLLLGWLGAMLGVGLAFLPWLRIAIVQTLYHTMAWIDEPTAGSLRDVPLRLVLGSGVMVLPDILRWIGLAGLTCLIGWGAWQAKRQSPAVREAYGFIAAWALVPLGVIMAVAILYPVFQLKQFLIVLVPWLMLVVAAIGGLPAWAIRMRGKQRLIPLSRLAYLAVFLTALPTLAYQVVTLEKDDWRGATAYLAEQACPGDVVFGNPAAVELALELYAPTLALPVAGYPPDYDIVSGGWAGGEPLTAELAAQEMESATDEATRVWLVEFAPQLWDAQAYLAAWLEQHTIQKSDVTFGRIRLRLYQISADFLPCR